MVDRRGLLDVELGEFRSFVTSFVSRMSFDVKSVRELRDGSLYVFAETTNPMGGQILSVVRAGPYEKEVDSSLIKELDEEMIAQGAVRAAFLTTSDFTGDAMEYARGRPISLIDRFQIVESLESRKGGIDDDMKAFLEKYGLTEKRFLGEDHIFIPGRVRDEVLKYFEGKKKKSRLGFKGGEEKIEEIETRYAPVAMLRVTVSSDVHLEGDSLGKTENDDFLFVNLNNGDLYYIIRRRSAGAADYSVESSSILKDILELPGEARDHLIHLLEHGELPYKHLDNKFVAILESKGVIRTYDRGQLFSNYGFLKDAVNIVVFVIQEVFDLVQLFIHDIMGTEAGVIDRRLGESGGGDSKEDKSVQASVNMPHLYGGIYDLKKFLVVKMVSGLKLKTDRIRYHSSEIASLLKSIFSAVSVSRRGVLFMPYFICTYRGTDVKGLRRREALIAPKFISQEEKDARKRRSGEDMRKADSLKFDALPYKIIR